MARQRPTELIEHLVTGTGILVNEGIMDVFGHVAVRDPDEAGIFWLARACAPARLRADDLLPFDLDGSPIDETGDALYSERFIHAAVFRADPTATASCHHHAASIMPFCMGGQTLHAVSQTGAWMGCAVPLWDSRTKFGDTAMLVNDMEQAADLASTLAEQRIVLMRGHGALVTGTSIQDVIFRSIHACREADTLAAALRIGSVTKLSEGEIKRVGTPSPAAVERAWAHWTARLEIAKATEN
ncbi:class II aldolase/adducin family protein [Pseudohoeflea coraliihabitans]|uniref:Class II aldolase/adducin family protein n=1 Tax=Pseudohoeflea coraliihabitans TaxID=2860393 RepID=A0ABS6WMQ8_9HYPH|nr:class II aldolase/adducin family protein [Pseudohoeflea sp. DP4N28-3]MBW3097251.1 class II aldolase/adducin family protein [Pseudohoeflea sp. DP4N28-3]